MWCARAWPRAKGKLPIKLSGAEVEKAIRIGATGVSINIMAAMQLAGEAGDMQLRAPNWRASSTWAEQTVAN